MSTGSTSSARRCSRSSPTLIPTEARQTLLCHQRPELSRSLDLARVFSLHAASSLTTESEPGDLASEEPLTFKAARGGEIVTKLPSLKAALTVLGRRQGQPLAVESLWKQARALLGLSESGRPDERELLARSLLECAALRLIELYVDPPHFAASAGERPRASALARAQARRGGELATLTHQLYRVEGPELLKLIGLLDGTRDRHELLAALREEALTSEDLDRMLATLAQRAVLLA